MTGSEEGGVCPYSVDAGLDPIRNCQLDYRSTRTGNVDGIIYGAHCPRQVYGNKALWMHECWYYQNRGWINASRAPTPKTVTPLDEASLLFKATPRED